MLFSRRKFAALIPAVALAAQKAVRRAKAPLPRAGEFYRFIDAQTELPLTRLTTLASSSFLPPSSNRITAGRERFLLFASDRDGSLAPYTMDLRTGVATQVADTDALRLDSLQLGNGGKSAYFVDGGKLTVVTLSNRKSSVLAEDVSAISIGAGPGEHLFVRGSQLFGSDNRSPLASGVTGGCGIRPGQLGCFYVRGEAEAHKPSDAAPNGREFAGGLGASTGSPLGTVAPSSSEELWYVNYGDSLHLRTMRLATGSFFSPFWSPDGRTILLLREKASGDGRTTVVISEITPEAGESSERVLATTSRYACFAANSDASVFVGASASKAQPSVLLLVRSAGRELTLCEHRAHDAAAVSPSFSPDNHRVYFASDFQGRPAVYAINVETLVEPAAS